MNEALRRLRALVEDGQRYLVDSERFRTIINAAFEVLSIRETDLAHACGVSIWAVQRWRRGIDMPYNRMRVVPYRWILEQIDAAQAKETP